VVAYRGPGDLYAISKAAEMTPFDVMAENAILENECYMRAKAELSGLACNSLEWIRAVAKRAQEIKQERISQWQSPKGLRGLITL